MSRHQSALELEDDYDHRPEEWPMRANAPRRRPRARRSGSGVIGIVGKNWVVLDTESLTESFSLRRSVRSALRGVCRLLAID